MKKKPNVVLVLTDDQGAWAMHCAGNEELHTPNLDRIAQNGVRFDDFFCASPVCSPARASILTGRIPSQHGVHDWIRGGSLDRDRLTHLQNEPELAGEDRAIPYLEGMLTYTDVLADNGYTCALSGKWHVGDSMRPQHGFSKWFTIGRGGCHYTRPDIVEKGEIHFREGYITDMITDKALEFIDQLGEEGNPYYLSVHYTAPHSPWEEEEHPKEYIEMYRDCPFHSTPELPIHPNQIQSAPYGTGEKRKELLRGYYAAITAMDAGVGRILNRLEERGELDDTLLIFMGDNGMSMGHHGIWGKGNGTFPLNLYDTAVKVPLLISWPGRIPKGEVSRRMCSQYDFMPTLLDLLDIPAQLPDSLPGRSFKDAILHPVGEDRDETAVVVFDEYGPNRMIRTREWKLVHRYPYGPDELYHLSADPGEENNLIGEVSCQEIRAQLQDQLNRWFDRYVNPRMDAAKEGVTGYGQLRRCGYYSEGRPVYQPLD